MTKYQLLDGFFTDGFDWEKSVSRHNTTTNNNGCLCTYMAVHYSVPRKEQLENLNVQTFPSVAEKLTRISF